VPEIMNYLQSDPSQTSKLDARLTVSDLIQTFGHRAARCGSAGNSMMGVCVCEGGWGGEGMWGYN
jgi:hypothetical protein